MLIQNGNKVHFLKQDKTTPFSFQWKLGIKAACFLKNACYPIHLDGGDLSILPAGGLLLFCRWPKLSWWFKNVAECQTKHLLQFQPQTCPQILSPFLVQWKSFPVLSNWQRSGSCNTSKLTEHSKAIWSQKCYMTLFSVILLQFQFQAQFYHFKTVIKVRISNSTIKTVISEVKCKKYKVV